jgi:hypothetical protein
MKATALLIPLLLAACSSAPPPPDWKMNAVNNLDLAQQRWLEGESAIAEANLQRLRTEIAKSGRLDLLARAELGVCAAQAAGLDFSPCAGYAAVAGHAAPAETAYARFLAGQWNGLDAKLLPAHYAAVVNAKDDAGANKALADMAEPLPRLIAAGLLFKQTRLQPAGFALAVETSSERGWRRALLAWLKVEKQRAEAAGDSTASRRLDERINFVQGSIKKP